MKVEKVLPCEECGAGEFQVCKVGCKADSRSCIVLWEPCAIPDIEVSPEGGRHTRLDTRCDLLPAVATLEKAKVLKTGAARHGEDNWRKISRRSHINHALTHIFEFMRTGRKEDLINAACRLDFAIETSDPQPKGSG